MDSVILCMFCIIYEMVFDGIYIYTMYKEIEKNSWVNERRNFTWKRRDT